jgi:chromosome segregation ATPase
MELTLRQASEKSGKSVDALRRAIKAGRLTATMGEKGYVIDQRALDDFATKPAADTAQVTKKLNVEVDALTAALEAAQVELTAAQRRIDELERDKDQLARAFEVMTDSFAASSRSRPALDATPTAPKRRPWRWRGGGMANP